MSDMSNLKTPGVVVLLLLLNAAYYVEPRFLEWSNTINLTAIALALIVLGKRSVVILPLLIFTPMQLHTVAPLFSLTLVYNLAIRTPKMLRLSVADLRALCLTILAGAYAALVAFVSTDLTRFWVYYIPYMKAVLIVLLAIVVKREKVSVKLLLIFTPIIGGISAVYKILYQENSSQISSALAHSDEIVSGLGTIYHEGDFVGRLLYAMQEPNFTALELLVCLTLCLSWFSRAGAYKWISHEHERLVRTLALICCLSLIVQIFGTFSRSGVFSAIAMVGLYLITQKRQALIGLAVASAAAIYVLNDDALAARLVTAGADTTFTGRTNKWSVAFDSWGSSPFFGNGFGEFLVRNGDAAHSTWLELLANQGAVGFLLFILQYVAVAFLIRVRVGDLDYRVLGTALLPLILMLQTVTFYQVDLLMFFFVLVLLSSSSRTKGVERHV